MPTSAELSGRLPYGAFSELLKIRPKVGPPIQFKPNSLQLRYRALKAAAIKRGDPARFVTLKHRQWGGTTEEQAQNLYITSTMRGMWAATYAHKDEAVSDIFKIALLMYESITEPQYRSNKDGKPLLVFDRRTQNSTELDFWEASSKFIIGSAEEHGAGHSKTIQKLHCSEFAHYPEGKVEAFWSGVSQTVPADGEITLESTPNGASGKFFDFCQQAQDRPGRPWTLLLFLWFEDPQYALPVTDDEAHEILAQVATGQGHELASEEQDLAQTLGHKGIVLTAGQWKWRRFKRYELGKQFFAQYPEDAITCFLTSGRLFFDGFKIDEYARKTVEAPKRTEEHGDVWIWEEPIEGRRYIMSADVAQGETIGENSDYSTITITDRDTGEDVLEFMGHDTPDVHGRMMNHYGRHYNAALAAPERNGHGFTVLKTLEEFHYPNIYYFTDGGAGFPTTKATRQPMLDDLDEALRREYYIPRSSRFINQARTFIVLPSGKPEHAPGKHDDLVVCKGVNYKVRTSDKSFLEPKAV